MPNVFIVQEDHMKNFEAARQFGEIHVVLKEREARELNNDDLIELMHRRMSSIENEDYLLLVGSPKVIGMAFMVANHYLSSFKILVWDRLKYKYHEELINE